MHAETFEHLTPSDAHKEQMQKVRAAAKIFSESLEINLPEGPDKTFVLRQLRTVVMWANVAITRNPDGSPRT